MGILKMKQRIGVVQRQTQALDVQHRVLMMMLKLTALVLQAVMQWLTIVVYAQIITIVMIIQHIKQIQIFHVTDQQKC